MDEPRILFSDAGRSHLHHLLASSPTPATFSSLAARLRFDAAPAPHAEPLLAALEAAGVPRGEAFRDALKALVAELLVRVERRGRESGGRDPVMRAMLGMTFGYVEVPELAAVPLGIMERMDEIPAHCMAELCRGAPQSQLFQSLPPRLKTLVRERHPKGFFLEVEPFVQAFCAEPWLRGEAAAAPGGLRGVIDRPRERRREDENLRALGEVVGASEKLFSNLKRYICTRYVEEQENIAYCTLLYDVTMGFYERRGVNPESDIVFEICSELDNAMESRELCLNENSAAKIRFLVEQSVKDKLLLAEAVMAIAGVTVINLVTLSFLKYLETNEDVTPTSVRNNKHIENLTSLMLHSHRASKQIQDTKILAVPDPSNQYLFERFYPVFLRTFRENAHNLRNPEDLDVLDPMLGPLTNNSGIARRLFASYGVYLLHVGDAVGLYRLHAVLEAVKKVSRRSRFEVREASLAAALVPCILEQSVATFLEHDDDAMG